jgi:single-strand DNA-binding protein
MNNVLLTGYLTRDAELIDYNTGSRKAIKFTLAVDRNFKNANGEREVDFVPVVYFTNHSHKLMEYLTKGKLISVSGKISIRTIEQEAGNKKYFTNIVADKIDFLSSARHKA